MLQGLAGSSHGEIDIVDCGSVDGADLLFGSKGGSEQDCQLCSWKAAEDSRGVDGGDLLLVAGLDEFVVDEEAQRLGPSLPIGSSELDIHISETW